jgi:hypothetical protein
MTLRRREIDYIALGRRVATVPVPLRHETALLFERAAGPTIVGLIVKGVRKHLLDEVAAGTPQ